MNRKPAKKTEDKPASPKPILKKDPPPKEESESESEASEDERFSGKNVAPAEIVNILSRPQRGQPRNHSVSRYEPPPYARDISNLVLTYSRIVGILNEFRPENPAIIDSINDRLIYILNQSSQSRNRPGSAPQRANSYN